MPTTNVIVIDDSPTMRAFITQALEADSRVRVIGTAGDPYEAREAIKRLQPDVVTLDVEMPRMNGLEFLEKIMRLRPMPVVMISSLTQKGGEAAIEALAMGAFDCVGKPRNGDIASAFADLPRIVRAAGRVSPERIGKTKRAAAPVTAVDFNPNGKLIAIGASTGGVDALTTLLSGFPANCPPTVIVQHMPPGYTHSFAARLDKRCAPTVREATDNAPLSPGHVYIAPGSSHLEIDGFQSRVCRLGDGEPVSGHRPSVDVLFRSAARYRDKVVGVLLTGMGRDGAEGLREIRAAGGRTIGQDERSCVVYGMPRAAFEIGAVQQQISLREIAAAALRHCTRRELAA